MDRPTCGGCNPGHPLPPDALTVAQWDALAAARTPRTPVLERLAGAIHCPACFRLRCSPGHWMTCR